MLGKSGGLPTLPARIDSSSVSDHPRLHRSVHTFNRPEEFIFHTRRSDPNPVVRISLEAGPGIDRIYLYNRTGSPDIAGQIVGVRIRVSEDGVAWTSVVVSFTADFIAGLRACEVRTAGQPIRHIEFTRPAGGVIHLSQITLGVPRDPDDIDPLQRLVEKFSLVVAPDGHVLEHEGRRPGLRVTGPSQGSDGIEIDALVLHRLGRFSNALIALGNAVHVARQVGASTIWIDVRSAMELQVLELAFSGFLFGGRSEIPLDGDLRLARGTPGPEERALHGEFFYTSQTGLYGSDQGSTADRIASLGPALSLDVAGPALPASSVVIHIRSGDVFRRDGKVHPGYGQPPLGYYTSIIEREGYEDIRLVFEDRENPVIDALESFLQRRGIRYSLPGSCLADDIALLLSARNVIAGFGTFVPAILALSTNIEHAFFMNGRPDQLLPKHVICTVLFDRGSYTSRILRNNWDNSEAARRLMLDYEADSLEVLPDPRRLV